MRLSELPPAARSRILVLAAAALGAAGPSQIPAGLAAVARFTPGKRAQRGATVLAKSLERDSAFRSLVAQRAHEEWGQELDDAQHGGSPQVARTPADRIALAWLTGQEPPQDALDEVRGADELEQARASIAALSGRLAELEARTNDPALRQPPHGLEPQEVAELRQRVDKLTTRLREQGTLVRRLTDAAERAQGELTELRRVAEDDVRRAQQAKEAAERRAAALAQRLEALQQDGDRAEQTSARNARALTRRVELLLQTAAAAVDGLRTEWTGTAERPVSNSTGEVSAEPADQVLDRLGAVRAVRPAPEITDTARLSEAMSIPGLHLIVDGYNVSKSAFGHLTLAEQRDRLVRLLAPLAGAQLEVTVVFDGSDVVAPASLSRAVRVVFSPPGVIADDVIRALVAGEPRGRPVVVATSDRAVVRDVIVSGARTVSAQILLAAVLR